MTLQSLIEALIGLFFLINSLFKFIKFDIFLTTVLSYNLFINVRAAFAAGMTIVFFEFVAGMTLIFGWEPWASLLASALLLSFALVVCVTLSRANPPSSCGCWPAKNSRPLGWYLCLFNLTLVMLLSPSFGLCSTNEAILASSCLAILTSVVYRVEMQYRSTKLEKT